MSDDHGGHAGGDPLEQIMKSHSANHEEHGEGNWLVSYADMMTLLVGFFVILMSFSTVDDDKFDELKKAVSQQFGGQYQVPYGDLADHLREILKKAGLGDQFVIKQTPQGVEISFQGTVFFNLGSSDLKSDAAEVLQKLIPVIHGAGGDFDITVEGHTDDLPIGKGLGVRNNWELSCLRAARVLEQFALNGFAKDHLTATGFGDARPVVPNRDTEGNAIPANQAQNRRVVIKVLKHERSLVPPTTDKPEAAKPSAEKSESPS